MSKESNRRILITGASGQLGRSFAKIADWYPELTMLLPDEADANITDEAMMHGLISGNDVSAVINCAAYTAVDKAEDDPETAARVNSAGPAGLAGICAGEGIPLIHFSTDYVFDGSASEPYDESAPTGPLNVYGRTKLDGERAVAASGCDAAVIRTSWVYSEFGNNFVATMLRLGGEGRPLKVVDDQYGTPTYATDLARAALYILDKGIVGYDVINFNALGDTTWYGFAAEIFRQAGMRADLTPVPTAGYPSRAMRPAYGVLNVRKALELGAPLRPWQDALADCLNEIKMNG